MHVVTPPVGDGPWPGVVVLHEAFGLNDDIREHAGRLAAAGYLAVAPDLFRGRGMRRCLVATFKALSAERGAAVRGHRGRPPRARRRATTARARSA